MGQLDGPAPGALDEADDAKLEDLEVGSLDGDVAQITRYGKNIQLSRYATGGSGTDADPYVLDIADVFDDLDNTAETDLVVDGIFEVSQERDVPPQYRFWGGTGRPETDRGSVIRAGSSFSGTSVVTFGDNASSIPESNYGGAFGVFFDAANNADRCITTFTPGRNLWFRDCVFGNALSLGVVPGGRRTAFYNCNIRDVDASGAIGLDVRCQQIDWIGGRFATNEQDVFIEQNEITGSVRLENITFTNIYSNPSVQIGNPLANDPESEIILNNCAFVDFRNAVNGIRIAGGTFDVPITLSNIHFDGTNTQDDTATGNKAINDGGSGFNNGLQLSNITAKNFTNTPVVDVTGNIGDVQVGSVEGSTYANKGEATLSSGSASVSVSHGLATTPTAGDINVTATGDLGSASYCYFSNIGPTSFDINVDADPTQDVTFAWQASLGKP